MRWQKIPEENRTDRMVPPARYSVPWCVRTVVPLPEYRLSVEFADGPQGIVDLHTLITSPQAGVFARLRDRARFEQVHVAHGVVTWPGEIDLAPDAMYDEIKRNGRWVVE